MTTVADAVALVCGAVVAWWAVGMVAGFIALAVSVWRGA